MPPDPLVYERRRRSILFRRTNFELLPPGLLFLRAIVSIILRILPTQKDISFLSRKKVHLPYRLDIYFKDCWHEVRLKLNVPPPPSKKAAYAAWGWSNTICFSRKVWCTADVSNVSPSPEQTLKFRNGSKSYKWRWQSGKWKEKW